MTHPQPLLDAVDWNPVDADVVLIAADEHGVETARALLATLPADARGAVFLEAEHLDDVERVEAPPRFSVRLLIRDRGQSLDRAVDAWLQEMVPAGASAPGPRVYAWVSSRGPARSLSA